MPKARLDLVDTGLVWRAAHSGRTVYRSSEMAAMLAAARAGAYDVLLVGYVSRWQRNLRRILELLEDVLHPAGVAVYFCDEEILSSSDRHWDQLVDEAKDAERCSRRLARRIREGYASKRTKQADPGGHAPFGFRRNEAKLVEPDPDQIETVRWMFEPRRSVCLTARSPRRAGREGGRVPTGARRCVATRGRWTGEGDGRALGIRATGGLGVS